MDKYYHQHGIPGMVLVYAPFIKLCQSTCNDKPTKARGPVHRMVENAISAQCDLGHDIFLRGYLAKEWLDAIKHFQQDKPEEKFIHRYLGLWRSLFAAVWEQQNATLHGESSLAEKYEKEKITTELLEWKRISHLKLGYEQQYLGETIKLLIKSA